MQWNRRSSRPLSLTSLEAKVTVAGVPDRPGIAAKLFRALADQLVNVDMIEQNVSLHGTTDISFTVPHEDLALAQASDRRPAGRDRCHRYVRRPRNCDRLDSRGRDEDAPWCLCDNVRGAGDRRHKHRDDLDLDHPPDVRGPRVARPTVPSSPCTKPSAWTGRWATDGALRRRLRRHRPGRRRHAPDHPRTAAAGRHACGSLRQSARPVKSSTA